jgi:plasmid stabilization system protein ParE
LQILEERIAQAAAPITAERYVDAIVDFCMSLQTFAARGVAREDLLPGLRITHFRKRAIIACLLDDETVSIVDILSGGQDYETALGSKEGKVKSGNLVDVSLAPACRTRNLCNNLLHNCPRSVLSKVKDTEQRSCRRYA